MTAEDLAVFLTEHGYPVVSVIAPSEDRATWLVDCPPGTPDATVRAATVLLRSVEERTVLSVVGAIRAKREAAVLAVRASIAWTLLRLLGRRPTDDELRAAIEEWTAVYQAVN